ncbi:MAG: carbohydrate binding domain-containing protein, partial [Candidatus Hadarchaeales archaeon]
MITLRGFSDVVLVDNVRWTRGGAEPGFVLNPEIPAISISQDNYAEITLSAIPLGGYENRIFLTCTQKPDNVEVEFIPDNAVPPFDNVTLKITVGEEAENGNHVIRIKGQGEDGKERTATLLLRVGNFGASVTPENHTVQAGENAQATVSVSWDGYADKVSLTVGGTVSGMKVELDNNSLVPPYSSTMTISVSPSVPSENYPITITARTDDGRLARSCTFTLEVLGSRAYRIYTDNGIGENLSEPVYYDGGDGSENASPWTIDLTEVSGGCENDNLYSWRISYLDGADHWGGFYLEFHDPVDMSAYNAITFSVRGKHGGEKFKIKVKDNLGNENEVGIASYITVTKEWQEVSIPLEDFGGIDLTCITIPWNIAFTHDYTGDNVSVYIDHIRWEETVLPGFSLSVDPQGRPILQGCAENAAVSVTGIGGYDKKVKLSAQNVPENVMVEFDNDNLVPPFGSTMTITVGENAENGVYAITVKGTGEDGRTASSTFYLTIGPYRIYTDNGLGLALTGPFLYDGGDGTPNAPPWTVSVEDNSENGAPGDNQGYLTIRYTDNEGYWGGVYYQFEYPVDMSCYNTMTLWVKGESGGENLMVKVEDELGHEGWVRVTLENAEWSRLEIPLGAFEVFGVDLSRITIPLNIRFEHEWTKENAAVHLDFVSWENLPSPPSSPYDQITLGGFPDNLNIPENGSVTVTEFTLTNGYTDAKTLRVVCDAWSVSGGKLWCDIYTMNGDNVFVNGTAYPLTLNPFEDKSLKLTIGNMSAAVGENFVLHLYAEDWWS